MSNKVDLILTKPKKTVRMELFRVVHQHIGGSFSTNHSEDDVRGWMWSKDEDYWTDECPCIPDLYLDNVETESCGELEVDCRVNDFGDMKDEEYETPFDDEIQEWIDEQK